MTSACSWQRMRLQGFWAYLSVLVGVHAISANGGCADLGFMRVLATTRASAALNAAVEGWESGLDPVLEMVEKNQSDVWRGGGRRATAGGIWS
jgi:hypothetical protein